MSHEPEAEGDDLSLRKILRAIDVDVVVPDLARLAELRTESSAVFAAHLATEQSAPVPSSPPVNSALMDSPMPLVLASHSNRIENRQSRSLVLAMRTALLAVVSVVVVAMWFISHGPAPVDAALVPFSKILDELRGAGPLEFQLVKNGTASQFLVRNPESSEQAKTNHRYQIAEGTRLWQVDDMFAASDAKRVKYAAGDERSVDLLALLDVGVTDSSALLKARPVGRTMFPRQEVEARVNRILDAEDASVEQKAAQKPAVFYESKSGQKQDSPEKASDKSSERTSGKVAENCLVYRVELPGKEGRIRVEAFVNERDHRQIEIVAWPARSRRNTGVPLAEMRLIAMNAVASDARPQPANSLTDDGRIGKIVQSQGIVVLRPTMAKRWTPVGSDTVIKPGDWLRTERRGANASLIRLTSDVALTVGPGTQIELISPSSARIHEGVLQVQSEAKTADGKNSTESKFTLLAPRIGSREFNPGEKNLVRVDAEEELVDVAETPVWLAGFEGTTNNESLGSLIVNLPDGRNEPLTVGYHHVSVEIRDQIARTTIEESFVNHTASRLEGIFHFPLPQDASISGFGMWIGNELVEADIVEKQRAREIYETILREKRDPGLLEWTGGNIFKARVFPIEARSEKRIKIVYTQVLPLRGTQYRYAYGLRSELLRTSPLRELSLAVTVNSALALKGVTCPTHPVRVQQTGHSARVEFAAQEYTPSRDFEVVCEIDGQQSDLVMVPHRRGDDGYFLVQITPPDDRDGQTAGAADLRELVPDGKPLNLILLCDTSGSMDSEKRKQQSAFVDTVLSVLGRDDRFQLAACDVGTAWATNEPVAANSENRTLATAFLDARVSLGWTNLDRAFDDVLKKAAAGTQVVYIGDGIVSSDDTDPAAFVQRLRLRVHADSKTNATETEPTKPTDDPFTFHSVAVGNSYESVVLKGITSIGRGSTRIIGTEQTPQVVAHEMLNEITRPGLRDISVEFRGMKVAAVYPDRLPNLPAGSQQILVGRYLPESNPDSGNQQGEVIVTGMRGSKKVTFAGRVSFKNAEDGNSFIPRLWARSHLDHLLTQGASRQVMDDIIRLSEEFHIITPYTSLLVLETDADRERFAVQRRHEMRDGERFFAAGRDNANFELLQQQIVRAKNWRTDLRRQVLKSLRDTGRQSQVAKIIRLKEQRPEFFSTSSWDRKNSGIQNGMNRWGEPAIAGFDLGLGGGGGMGGMGGGMGGMRGEINGDMNGFDAYARSEMSYDFGTQRGLEALGALGSGRVNINRFSDSTDLSVDTNGNELGDWALPAGTLERTSSWQDENDSPDDFEIDEDHKREMPLRRLGKMSILGELLSDLAPDTDMDDLVEFSTMPALRVRNIQMDGLGWAGGRSRGTLGLDGGWLGRRSFGRGYYEYGSRPDYVSWVGTIFPALAPPSSKPVPVAKDSESWSVDALKLAKSLLRTESLQGLSGGIEVLREVESFNANWNRSSGFSHDLALYSPTAWVTRGQNPQEQTLVNYCNATERGVYSLAFLLGRSRASVSEDLKSIPLSLDDLSLTPLAQVYRDYAAKVEPTADGQMTLILNLPGTTTEIRLTIDPKRHVVLKRESFHDGKLTDRTMFEELVEIAGSWWATKVTTIDDQGRKTSETRLSIRSLTPEQFTERMTEELHARSTTQFIHLPLMTLAAARQRIADGRESFDDRLMLILHNARLQQWDEMWKHVDAAEQLAVNKPGVRWLRSVLQVTTRRNEDALTRLSNEASRLAAAPQQDEVFLAQFILGQVNAVTAAPEFAKVLQSLKPVYFRPAAERVPAWPAPKAGRERLAELATTEVQRQIRVLWTDRQVASLDAVGQSRDAIALLRSQAEEIPWERHRQELYANRLAGTGEVAAAHEWLRKSLARPEWTAEERDSLRSAVAQLYRQQAQWADLLTWTTDWIAGNPISAAHDSAYIQHLSALIYNDQLETAYRLAEAWIRDARVDGKLSPLQRAKLDTAIRFAEGNVYDMNFQRMDDRWFEPLADTARFFMRSPQQYDIAQRCFTNHYLIHSDVGDQLRGEWLAMLTSDLDKLSSGQIDQLVSWALSGRIELQEPINRRRQMDAQEVPDEIWTRIADHLKSRWVKSENPREKSLFGESLRTIYANRFADTELLPFLRERIASAPADHKSAYVVALFEALLTTNWSDAIEAEAFSRWRELTDQPLLADRLAVELPALFRLNDAMLANRISLAEQQLADQGESNKLTRKELAKKKAEIRFAAKTALSERLAKEIAREEKTTNRIVVPIGKGFGRLDWLKMEQVWLNAGLNQEFAQLERECWSILGEVPITTVDVDDTKEGSDDEVQAPDLQDLFDAALRQRALTTLMDLAVRKRIDAASVDRLLKYIDLGIQSKPAAQGIADTPTKSESSRVWRQIKFRFLVALDRPDELEQQLRAWIRDDVSMGPWRQSLARLLAERGKIDEAIVLFEACQRDKLLSAADFQLLSDLYLAMNRRADYDRCRIEALQQTPEWNLAQIVNQFQNQSQQSEAASTTEVDDRTRFAIDVLLKKSANPENYFWQLQSIYSTTHDFRLMQMLPDAILGRSPQQVYSELQGMQNSILSELRNEATADEILARINSLRKADQTSTNRRALDLLEALIERKSSEVLNQPGPHVDACVAALQRAFERDWADGELLMMSQFLKSLGHLPDQRLQEEQLREMRSLQQRSPQGSRERLQLTINLCQMQFWNYQRKDEAVRELEAESQLFLQANKGHWPYEDDELLGQYVQMLQDAGRHGDGEKMLQSQFAGAQNDQERRWLKDRLLALYLDAFEDDGSVSIGSGRRNLFRPIVDLSYQEIAAAPHEHTRYTLIAGLNNLFLSAFNHKLPDVASAMQQFAFQKIPPVLRQQQNYYRNTVTSMLESVSTILGPKACLQFVVERMEQWPQRFEIQHDNSWNAFGHELGARRKLVGASELDDRILKLALAHLKQQLRNGESAHQSIYRIGSGHFWEEKSAEFASAAEEVLKERPSSGRRAMIVASYLRDGLSIKPRAIEILLVAHRKGLLDENAQMQLVHWLRDARRFAEMIPILESLVAAVPDRMAYRVDLMSAYFETKRPQQMKELLQQTHEHFHQDGRWTEQNIESFAIACQGCEEWERARQYWNEAIALHQRTNPASGLNDATLSNDYQHLAQVESHLNLTDAAVTSASAAIVCWGARQEQRQTAIDALRQVLSDAQDLDAYVERLDAQAKTTGQDSPILRKLIGEVYRGQEEFLKAIAQFNIAMELQPHDPEVHQALIACYDKTDQSALATRQLLKLIDDRQHDLPLYQQLASRLQDNEAEAERAATSMVESAPNEAESHAALAELRQSQNRWDEAIPQWQQVASLRKLEPTGLLKLTEAQLHEKQWDAARESIQKLNATAWPARFNLVPIQIRQLEERLPK